MITACFPAGTKVKLANGKTKDISKIEVGDKVVSGSGTIEEVTEVMEPAENLVFEVFTNTGDRVNTTLTQGIMTEGGQFRLLKDIHVGHMIQVGEDTAIVISKLAIGKKTVYDFKTTGENTYIVNGGFIVNGGSAEIWGV